MGSTDVEGVAFLFKTIQMLILLSSWSPFRYAQPSMRRSGRVGSFPFNIIMKVDVQKLVEIIESDIMRQFRSDQIVRKSGTDR